MVCATSKGSDQPAQSDQSLCLSLEYYMSVKLLTEHHLELLSLKGGCTGLSESTLVKTPHCWKSYVTAQYCLFTERVENVRSVYIAQRDSTVTNVYPATLVTHWLYLREIVKVRLSDPLAVDRN